MKRILSLILALILVVGLIPVQANAATDSEGFVYEVYEDHVEITGYTGNEWWPTVPAEIERKPVTTIASNAFYRIPIRSIYIPDSVTSIGFGAFSSCSLLMNIHVDKNNPSYSSDERGVLFNKDKTLLICFPSAKTDFYAIPDSVTALEYYAFRGCRNLSGVSLPNGITTIPDGAFQGCESLTSFIIPDSVTHIGEGAFAGCEGLTSIIIPARITRIDLSAFENCESLKIITFKGDPPSISSYVFDYLTATAYYPADNPNWTEDRIEYLYSGYTWSKNITWVPHTHEYIGDVTEPTCTEQGYTTYTCYCTDSYVDDYTEPLGHSHTDGTCFRCGEIIYKYEYTVYEDHVEITNYTGSATQIVIPSEIEGLPVTTIGGFAFFYSTKLTSIVIPDSVTYIGGEAFYSCDSLTDIVFPDSITYIADYAFACCDNLTSVFIPDSVAHIGEAAFYAGYSLTEFHVDENNPYFSNDDRGVLYDKEKTKLIQAPGAIEGSYVIPDGVTTIGNYSFDCCKNLTDIVIPDSVTHIGRSAFHSCRGLTDVTIPDSVTCIDVFAFGSCDNLASIFIPASVTFIGQDSFVGCLSMTGIYVDENNRNYSSDDRGVLFDKEKKSLIFAPDAIEGAYVIPDGVTSIGYCAFDDCSSLTDVTIPDSVTSLGKYAFSGCSNLTSICFEGNAPEFGNNSVFSSVTATAYYPIGNDTWTADVMQNYSGTITWKPRDPDHIHEYTAVVTAPTCTEQGFTTYTCACGESYVDDYVDALGHSYTAVVTNPTCTEQGFTTYTCACGDSYTTDPVEALGHDMSQWETQTAPTCTEDGTESRSCFRCDCIESRTVDALGHEYADGTCIYCGEADPDYEAPVEPPFTDVPAGAYYEAPVLWAMENGITSGVTADSFNPGGSCLRAQVVTFLWRAEGQPEPAITTSRFTDVKPTDFFFKPVLWAVEQNITSGVSATEFGSYVTCNRAAVVTFLWRAAGMPEPVSTNNPFTDVKSTDFFYKPVLWAVENNITAGLTATTFGPTAECNRAQVVTFLYRAYN